MCLDTETQLLLLHPAKDAPLFSAALSRSRKVEELSPLTSQGMMGKSGTLGTLGCPNLPGFSLGSLVASPRCCWLHKTQHWSLELGLGRGAEGIQGGLLSPSGHPDAYLSAQREIIGLSDLDTSDRPGVHRCCLWHCRTACQNTARGSKQELESTITP